LSAGVAGAELRCLDREEGDGDTPVGNFASRSSE
jgi:hypothetical protein